MTLFSSTAFDPEVFEELYQKYSERVMKFIYYRVSNLAEAEDLFSQTWELIFKQIHSVRTDQELPFQKWMFTVARHLIADHYRARKRVVLELDEAWSDDQPHLQEQWQAQEEHVFLHYLMERLPALQREILGLHFFSDLRIKDIADLLDMQENTVSQQLSRALKHLHRWMEKS